MINAALWSCTKDENVAIDFFKKYKKNVIINTYLEETLILIFMKKNNLNFQVKKKFQYYYFALLKLNALKKLMIQILMNFINQN